jgi:hypothetical protein
LVENKNRAGGNFVIFCDVVEMGKNLIDWSKTKILPSTISSFFATVSECAEIWQIDRKEKLRRGQFRHFSRRCRNGLKFGRLVENKNRSGGNFGIFRGGVEMGLNLTG